MSVPHVSPELLRIADAACAAARRGGASEAAAAVRRTRQCKVVVRDGQLEELKAAETCLLSLRLFVDGRYGTHTTNVLEAAALERFITGALEMTRFLQRDPRRTLPAVALYAGRSRQDLGLFDEGLARVTMAERQQLARRVHDAARAAAGPTVISVGAGCSDERTEHVLVQSNGLRDGDRATTYGLWADVTVRDPAGKRPEDWAESMARRRGGLADPAVIGGGAAQRALACIGAAPIPSTTLPLVVENRVVDTLLAGLLRPLDGRLLDQQQSCFEGQLGQAIAAPLLTVTDDPLLPGGWASRRFDWEGLPGRRRPIIEGGVLRGLYIDSYYGKKLKRTPTSSETTNLEFAAGSESLDGLCATAGKAILVTGFIGGNSNTTTGDFSHGLRGFLIDGGKRVRPVAGLNIAGNHREFWKKLKAVGNDPYPHAATLTPSLLFDGVVVAGT